MPPHSSLRHYRRYPRRSRTPRALRWLQPLCCCCCCSFRCLPDALRWPQKRRAAPPALIVLGIYPYVSKGVCERLN